MRRIIAALMCVILGLVVAGCSGGGDTKAKPSPGPGGGAEGQSKPTGPGLPGQAGETKSPPK